MLYGLSGSVEFELVSADIPGFLASANMAGVHLRQIHWVDAITVQAEVSRSHYKILRLLARKTGAKLRIRRRKGVYWAAKGLLKRPILLAGFCFLFAMTLYMPSRILFVYVEGNQQVPSKLIVERAESCGIQFGASRRDVRSEQVKNRLLQAIPQLQWVGVNTFGCVAVISVSEREAQPQSQPNKGVSSIVADRDGIIYSCTVTKGTPLCKTGQAVKAGETLVSGYTDCGIKIEATRAEAEIFAVTNRQLTVVTPDQYLLKGEIVDVQEKTSLIVGKNRINFFKDSGISNTTCDKMYLEYKLMLPGGFELPVSIVKEQWIFREISDCALDPEALQPGLESYGKEYLAGRMISGRVLTESHSLQKTTGAVFLQSKYTCLEMIGRTQNEEILK